MKRVPLDEVRGTGVDYVRAGRWALVSNQHARHPVAVRLPHDNTAPATPRARTPEPTIPKMILNFASATADWVRAGVPLATQDLFATRLDGCRQCPGGHWDELARAGLGKCKHPTCGCTKLKLWLATSRCPLRQW